jgi:hypothetical protein
MFAGSVAILASLKFLVQSALKRKKEAPMDNAFMLGVRSVVETFYAIGTSSIMALLPG